jgi:hypothetical protein
MSSPFSSPRLLLGKVYQLLSGLNSVAEVAGDRVATLEDLRKRDAKVDVKAATAAALPAYTRSGNTITADANGALAAVDGVTLVVNDRLLLRNGAAGADNGIWYVSQLGTASLPYILKRADDANTSAKLTAGSMVFASQGTTYGDSWFTLTTNNPITLNSTSLTFSVGSGLAYATYAFLASVANGQGASLIGLEDADSNFTATDVEAALVEARTQLATVAAPATLTIAGGAITATASHHAVDTEAAAASDNLDTINGMVDGQFLVLRSVNAARNVVLTSGVGNIFCPSNATITLDSTSDRVLLMRSGANIFVLAFNTVANGGGGLGLSLASSANGLGAALVGIEDAASVISAATVESALAEIAKYSRFASGAANPLVTYDAGSHYAVGCRYRNTTSGEIFVSVDSSAGAAVWKTVKPAVYSYTPAATAKRVTASAVKTAIPGVTGSLPASIVVGARIKIFAGFKVVGSNAADTGAFAVETSDGSVLLLDSAWDLTDGAYVTLSLDAVVEATGAAAKLTGLRTVMHTGGSPSVGVVADLAADLSAARTLIPYVTLSSANVGNIVDCRQFLVEVWTNP